MLQSASKLPLSKSARRVQFCQQQRGNEVDDELAPVAEMASLLSPENRPQSRSEKEAKRLKRRSIRTLNVKQCIPSTTNRNVLATTNIRMPTKTLSTSTSSSSIPQSKPGPSQNKFRTVKSSGYGRPNGAGAAPSRPASVSTSSRRGSSTNSSVSVASKRPCGPSAGLQNPAKRPRNSQNTDDNLRETIQGLEERIVKVEMAGAAVPAKAASHLTQDAHDRMVQQIQNMQNIMQQKEQDLAAKEVLLLQKDAKIAQLEAECSAKRAVLEQQSLGLEQTKTQLASQEAKNAMLRADLEERESKIRRRDGIIADQKTNNEELREQLRIYEAKQRELHETVQDLKGNIRVYCRVRPVLNGESGATEHFAFPDADEDKKMINLVHFAGAPANLSKAVGKWKLDGVFGPETTQEELFTQLAELVQSALHGYNVSVFAYGQTGSGKTFTMEGGPDPAVAAFNPHATGAGIIPRAVQLLFGTKDQLEKLGWKYSFKVSFLEIYNEELIDLLSEPGRPSDVKGRKQGKLEPSLSGKEVRVPGLTITEVKTPREVLGLVAEGLNRRSVGSTKCNERSSRSHALFQLHIVSQDSKGKFTESVLNLVDLAGSERLKESESKDQRLREAQHINSSLSTLKMVIRNQAQNNKGKGKESGQAFVAYRNSKLTMMLKNALGGGSSKTLMLTTVNPSVDSAEETKRTLDFALEGEGKFYADTTTTGIPITLPPANATITAASENDSVSIDTMPSFGGLVVTDGDEDIISTFVSSKIDQEKLNRTRAEMVGKTLRVVAMVEPPYVNYLNLSQEAADSMGYGPGVVMEILKELGEKLKVNYVVGEPPDGQWGEKEPDGNWTGMVGMLQRGEAEIVAGATIVRYDRHSVLDYSYPFMASDTGMLIRSPDKFIDNSFLIVTRPFSLGLRTSKLRLPPLNRYQLNDWHQDHEDPPSSY